MKKVLFVMLSVESILLAQIDYLLIQKFSGTQPKLYDFTKVGLVDWSVKSIALGVILFYFIQLVRKQELADRAIATLLTICLSISLIPLALTFIHVAFFGKGPMSNFGRDMNEMLNNVTFTRWANLAHLTISVFLVTLGFVYVFYFPRSLVKVINKTEPASEENTNEDV